MKSERTLAVVGCTDEATAHLRLLMRKGAHRLVHRWHFGSEDEADFVVVDPDDIYGAVARVRASARHMPFAIYCDDEHIGTDQLVLRRPLKLENVVDVLNAASRTLDGESVGKPDDLLQYFGKLYRFEPDAPEELKPATAKTEILEIETGGPGADPWGHDEGVVQPREPVVATAPDEAAERVESLRAKSRPAAKHHVAIGMPADPIDIGSFPLSAFVTKNLLAGASIARLEGLPMLVLDPTQRRFYSDVDLAELAPYAQAPVSRSAWNPIHPKDLSALKKRVAARPFRDLLWLATVVESGGRLAPRIDPRGAFRIKERVKVDGAFHAHDAIAAAMAEPARLHEIAAKSGASMDQVFDVVSAYEVIGQLDKVLKPAGAPPPAPPAHGAEPRRGLLQRLIGPFKKQR